MPTVTWDGSEDEHWDEDLNWDTGTAPTSSDDVVIPDASTTANDPELTGASPKNVNSIKVETDGIIVGAGSNIRAYGENGSGYVADFDGEISGVLSLQIKTSATTSIDLNASSGNIEHLYLDSNGDDLLINSENTCELNGNLTIEKGEFNANGNVLIVDGKTTIGDASHSAEDEATLTCGASLLTLGSGKTDDYAVQMLAGGTFAGGSANHTIGSIRQNAANTKFTFTAATTTINSRNISEDRMFEIITGKAYNADGRITLTGAFTSGIQWAVEVTGDTGPHTLRLNDASLIVKPRTALIVEENLNIDAGTFNTSHDYSANNALTVTGAIHIDGTLTGNASAISGDSVHIDGTFTHNGALTVSGIAGTNYAFQNLGTWTPSTSQVTTFTGDGDGTYHVKSNDWDSVVINAAGEQYIFRPKTGTAITFVDDLTVTAGNLIQNNNGDSWTVGGDVLVSDDTLGVSTATGNLTFGSLTIADGATFQATRGTTTITDEAVTHALENDGGTFTHNNGTVAIEINDTTRISMDGDNLYNLITGKASGADSNLTYFGGSATTTTVANDLTVLSGQFRGYNANNLLTVIGDVSVTGDLSYDGATAAMEFGTLTIESGGEYIATTATTILNGDGRGYGGYPSALENKSGGTFTNKDGTVLINSSGDQEIKMDGTGNVHNLTVSKSDNDLVHEGNLTVEGDLSITLATAHAFRPSAGSNTLTVTGDVTIVEGKLGDITNYTGAISFGSLTIEAGGTYIATTGQTTMKGNFANSGTFTNNDGKMYFEGPNSVITGTGLIFYDLDCVDGGSGWTSFKNDFTVENELDIQDWKGLQLKCVDNTVTLTMGTATAQGEITMLGAYTQIQGDSNTVNVATITGVNSLYPAIITQSAGTTGKFFTDNKCQLANVNVVNSFVTLGNTSTLTLTGDCEFDAVTIAANDTLDIGGQRVEFSGEFRNNGAMNSTGGGLMICHSDLIQTGVAEYIHDGDVNVIAYGGIGNDYSLGAGNTPSGPWATNLMINGDVTSNAHFGDAYGRFSPENIIVGNGTFTMANSASFATDITVANGGTFVPPTGNTMTCSGNFNLAGGLIGKSALTLDGSSTTCVVDDHGDFDSLTNATWMGWIKMDSVSGDRAFIGQSSSFNFQAFENANNKLQLSLFGGSWTDLVGTTTMTADDKWHHIAGVMDGSNNKMYIYLDGKLDAEGAWTQSLNGSGADIYIGGYRSGNEKHFSGEIGVASFWNVALTQAQIRSKMFSDFAGLDSNTGCKGWWQFDEGTGTSVASEVGSHTGTIANGAWAGAGAFTQGTSTVDLTGTGELILKGTVGFYNLKCAAATKTTTTRGLGSITIGIKNNIYVGDGTLTRTGGSPSWRFAYDTTDGSSQTLGGTVVSGATYPVDLHNTYVNYYHDTTLVKEVKWNYFIGTRGCTFSANQESTGYTSWNGGSATYDYGNYTLKADHAKFGGSSGTVNFDAGKLWLTSTSGLSASTASDTFTCGPGGTVSGSSAATTFKSQNDWAVVGRIENLNVTNEELNVTGQVINCTGEIHQWHPALDDAQQLDRDTAEDRDINLGRDLDKNTELVG